MFGNKHRPRNINYLNKCCVGLLCFQSIIYSFYANAQNIRPRLLFIPLAQDGHDQSSEETFLTTLKLNLDRYEMVRAAIDLSEFEEMPTQDQVDHLYPLIGRSRAQGAMWLSRGVNGVLTLHVTTMEAERTIIRLFRQQQGDDAPKELAQTVAALFESAYLLELEDIKKAEASCPPMEVTVREVPPVAHKVVSHWYLSVGGMGALAGHVGPSIQGSGRSGVLLDIASNLGLKLGLGGGFGPLGKDNGYTVDGWSLIGELKFLLHIIAREFQLGPVLGISGGLQSVRVTQNDTIASYRYPKADATLGLNISIPVFNARTAIELGLFLSPYRTEVTTGNDDKIIYRNQAFGWFISYGWYFF